MNIRKLKKTDLDSYKKIKLKSLRNEIYAFDTSYEEAIKWPKYKWEEKIKEFTNPEESIFYVIEDKEKIVGFIHMVFKKRKKKNHIVEFPTLYVDDEYRGKGLASRLMQTTLDDIRKNHKNIIKIQLSVYSPQTGAIALYKKFGFKVYGEFEKELCVEGKYYKQLAMELFL